MTAKMESKLKKAIVNPRYKGATPEMVGRALLRPIKVERQKPQKAQNLKPTVQSNT